jgi:hypothetical protein
MEESLQKFSWRIPGHEIECDPPWRYVLNSQPWWKVECSLIDIERLRTFFRAGQIKASYQCIQADGVQNPAASTDLNLDRACR